MRTNKLIINLLFITATTFMAKAGEEKKGELGITDESIDEVIQALAGKSGESCDSQELEAAKKLFKKDGHVYIRKIAPNIALKGTGSGSAKNPDATFTVLGIFEENVSEKQVNAAIGSIQSLIAKRCGGGSSSDDAEAREITSHLDEDNSPEAPEVEEKKGGHI